MEIKDYTIERSSKDPGACAYGRSHTLLSLAGPGSPYPSQPPVGWGWKRGTRADTGRHARERERQPWTIAVAWRGGAVHPGANQGDGCEERRLRNEIRPRRVRLQRPPRCPFALPCRVDAIESRVGQRQLALCGVTPLARDGARVCALRARSLSSPWRRARFGCTAGSLGRVRLLVPSARGGAVARWAIEGRPLRRRRDDEVVRRRGGEALGWRRDGSP